MAEVLYVHLDGMDLAGKGLACKNIVRLSQKDWEIRKNRLTSVNPIHDLADNLRLAGTFDTEIVGNLYLAALMADLKTFVRPQTDTLQDSAFALKSYAYHRISNTPRLPERFRELLFQHPQFSNSVILTASIESRKRRLDQRIAETPKTVTSGDLMIIKKPEKFLAVEECLIEAAQATFRSSVLDTSEMTPDEVVLEILRIINLRQND